MSNIYNINEMAQRRPSPGSSAQWTAIIPAAGRGTRLGSERPKLFYPVLGKPLFEWAIERLKPYCHQFVFVLAPGVESLVRPQLEHILPGRFSLVTQTEARGMGHAVSLCRSLVLTANCMIMWVDQVALRDETIAGCVALAERHPKAKMVIPTVRREKPYIKLDRDEQGRIRRVIQAREEAVTLEPGENDCGIFFFKSAPLFETLASAGDALLGARTGEINLLPVFPFLDQTPGDVVTLRIRDTGESVGLNTEADARELEKILRSRERPA